MHVRRWLPKASDFVSRSVTTALMNSLLGGKEGGEGEREPGK
jgi:hypothetical protein